MNAEQHYTIEVTPPSRIAEQQSSYKAWLQKLGGASAEEVKEVLAGRQAVASESDLSLETIQKLKQLLAQQENI